MRHHDAVGASRLVPDTAAYLRRAGSWREAGQPVSDRDIRGAIGLAVHSILTPCGEVCHGSERGGRSVARYAVEMKVGIACTVVGASALTGCSLLYNPNNLPAAVSDAAAPPDLYVLVRPDLLELDAAGPPMLFEGQGTGGSRPAILAITGTNLAEDASVALLPADGQSPAPMIQIDNAHAGHAPGVLAVPVTLAIDTSRGTTGMSDVALTVQVTQMSPGGPVVKTLEGRVVLRNLPELDAPITNSAALAPLYSRVQVKAGLSFTASAASAIVRAVSSIDVGDVHADGNGAAPGPGGAGGGASQAAGGGLGGGKPGTLVDLSHLSLLVAGSGGGFAQAGATGQPSNPGGAAYGDDLLVSYSSSTSSSGGGGGGASPGGGGGGTLELTAGGTLTTGNIAANGAMGGMGSLLAGAAGGGSGGVIVLRSGGPAKLGAISASGGAGGTTAPNGGGGGGGGRLQYDVPSIVGTVPMMPVASRQGAAFLEGIPLITNDPRQTLQLTGAVANDLSFKVFVLDAASITTEETTVTFAASMVAIKPTLNVGYNRVCVTPPLGNPSISESTNCIEIAYVP